MKRRVLLCFCFLSLQRASTFFHCQAKDYSDTENSEHGERAPKRATREQRFKEEQKIIDDAEKENIQNADAWAAGATAWTKAIGRSLLNSTGSADGVRTLRVLSKEGVLTIRKRAATMSKAAEFTKTEAEIIADSAEAAEEKEILAAWAPAAHAWVEVEQLIDEAITTPAVPIKKWVQLSHCQDWAVKPARAIAAAARATAKAAFVIDAEALGAAFEKAAAAWDMAAVQVLELLELRGKAILGYRENQRIGNEGVDVAAKGNEGVDTYEYGNSELLWVMQWIVGLGMLNMEMVCTFAGSGVSLAALVGAFVGGGVAMAALYVLWNILSQVGRNCNSYWFDELHDCPHLIA
eukprot:gnl/MRDRNA2_/MRDRNA2_56584_c0_seq1.p1 gnl/MRDRNA2_/MRDRNA2_56584_c0~~gnl/MRDRNA2_/MRDRNA2_56584_c0_seq1.p1  ORF type:complete len:350 (+),score=79.67 gnl/MRDRNA2_/MRDRNA2_56584_c0_seq1:287-1336(+)